MTLPRPPGGLASQLEQKLNPWMQPVFDNLELLLLAGGARRPGLRSPEAVAGASQRTKIVLTADPDPMDNPYVDGASRGLPVAAARLRDEPLTARIVLSKRERSEFANIAANRL